MMGLTKKVIIPSIVLYKKKHNMINWNKGFGSDVYNHIDCLCDD